MVYVSPRLCPVLHLASGLCGDGRGVPMWVHCAIGTKRAGRGQRAEMGLVTVKKALVKFATAYCVPRCCSADSGKSIGGSWESCGNPAATSRRAQDAHRCAAGVRRGAGSRGGQRLPCVDLLLGPGLCAGGFTDTPLIRSLPVSLEVISSSDKAGRRSTERFGDLPKDTQLLVGEQRSEARTL